MREEDCRKQGEVAGSEGANEGAWICGHRVPGSVTLRKQTRNQKAWDGGLADKGRGRWARSHFADEQTAGRALGLSGLRRRGRGLELGADAEPRLSGVGGRLARARPGTARRRGSLGRAGRGRERAAAWPQRPLAASGALARSGQVPASVPGLKVSVQLGCRYPRPRREPRNGRH